MVAVVLLLVTLSITGGFVWLTIFLSRKVQQGQPPDPRRPNPFACQFCGDEAPTIRAGLNRHIGMIVLMNHRSVKGRFCKPCFMTSFREYTLTTLFLGWWGVISLMITPIVLINNLVMLIRSFSLEGKPVHAIRPTLIEQQILNLQPRRDSIAQCLSSGETEESVTMNVAHSSGITPGQAYLFVRPIADGHI